jgi:hypothetical protein
MSIFLQLSLFVRKISKIHEKYFEHSISKEDIFKTKAIDDCVNILEDRKHFS